MTNQQESPGHPQTNAGRQKERNRDHGSHRKKPKHSKLVTVEQVIARQAQGLRTVIYLWRSGNAATYSTVHGKKRKKNGAENCKMAIRRHPLSKQRRKHP